jgi:digeranylgeranylglycerophospholipid reductase
MKIKDKYDIIVVGAGPAGSTAARVAAEAGARVLLLEKDRDIGVPVRCAEAVSKDGVENILQRPIESRWIADEINRFKFVAPDGTIVYPQVKMTGYVLHRRLFDYDLAKWAASKGVTVLTRAYVCGLLEREGYINGVVCQYQGQVNQIEAKVVIGADGVESRVGRWAGLDTTIRMGDMETCSQVTIQSNLIKSGVCEFYFSQKDFPGGYAWVFPNGKDTANVGLGIAGNLVRRKSPQQRMNEFMDKYYPGAAILSHTVGGVPCANRPKKISGDGFLLAGDAAFQSNPMTGGGITSGMAGAKIAGKVAAEAVRLGNFSEKYFRQYEKEWDRIGGSNQKLYYKVKEGIKLLSDEKLNDTAKVINNIPPEKQTLLKIFQTALSKQPSLLIDLIKLLSPFN